MSEQDRVWEKTDMYIEDIMTVSLEGRIDLI